MRLLPIPLKKGKVIDMKKAIILLWALILAASLLMSCTAVENGGAPVSAPSENGGAPVNAPSENSGLPANAPGGNNGAPANAPSEPTGGGAESGAQGDGDIPVVYMTKEITPESLVAIYRALGVEPTGNIAIKIHTGEPPNSNYLRPALIGGLVRLIGGTIVETKPVAGLRASNLLHMQVAKDHGFLDIAPFDLLDADGDISLPITAGEVLSEVLVGANLFNYDYYVVLSHFKGHGSAGYGGALKNMSIGLASAPGKSLIHSGGRRRTGYTGDQDQFLKGMAEASASIAGHLDGNLLYINVMNRLSVDCDCMGNPAEPDMHDIGVLSSLDPVALDQACVDLVYAAEDGASLIKRIEARNGIHTLEHAAAIGLGSREYSLVRIDD